MGSIYARGRKLWLRFKGSDGKWTQRPSPLLVGQEREARKLLERLEGKIAAGAEVGEAELGPITVERWAKRWIEERKTLVEDWKGDESKLRLHVLPKLGPMRLDEVRPRHLIALVRDLRRAGGHAPKTICAVYAVTRKMFRDAVRAEHIDASPCVLTSRDLPQVNDKNPEWRDTAVYSREELQTLISDERIPLDRRVLYALEGIGALRHGEVAGLRWRHYDPDAKPLGRLAIVTSYNRGRTKTGRTRRMPVHPTLAAILAE
jgi:integrase